MSKTRESLKLGDVKLSPERKKELLREVTLPQSNEEREAEKGRYKELLDEIQGECKEKEYKRWKEHICGFEKTYPNDINKFESDEQLIRFLEDCIHTIRVNEAEYALNELDTVFNRTKKEGFVIAREVNDYIMTTEGAWFSVDDIYRSLHLSTDDVGRRKLRKNISTCLVREKDKGIVFPSPYKDGKYRRVMADSEILDWKNAPLKSLDISWPFAIEELVDIYPSNVAVVAGNKDSGKSTLMFNIIRMNMHNHKIHYFSCEMAEQELRLRLEKFNDVEDWNFTPYLRSANYGDAIIGKEDDFIIFDWIATPDKAWRIGDIIKAIHDKLRGGFCIVVIQKESYKELGRGAGYTIDYARLYLTMQWGKIKILSGKNWHGTRNPAGLVHEFKIVNGAKIIPQGIWHEEDSDPFEKKGRY